MEKIGSAFVAAVARVRGILSGISAAVRGAGATAAAKVKKSIRRFRKRGGFAGAARRYIAALRAFRPSALIGTALVLVVLAGVPIAAVAASGGGRVTKAPAVVAVAAAPTPSPTPAPTPVYLAAGTENDEVMSVQERLMELGYMDYDEPTSYYGDDTRDAVTKFQRSHGLTETGIVDDATYTLLMSAEAKEYVMSIGAEGEDVYELQCRLRELDYINTATSYFGELTEAAVILFQQKNGLAVDGSVGNQTREMLYSEDARANALYIGSESAEVKAFQERLIKLGYLTGTADGKYGKATEAAVKRFQERSGLIADGYLGPETRRMLNSSGALYNTLQLGMSGDDVEAVQARLKKLGYISSRSVTGYYGSVTEAAVEAFQRVNGLSTDGRVGKNTLARLNSSSAKKNPSSVVTTPKPGGGTVPDPTGGGGGGGGSDDPSVATLLSIAKSKLGCKYVRGAKGANTFDCSGFVYWCLNQAGVKVSYMTSGTWRTTNKFPRISSMNSVRAGDILVFKGHVAIAASSTMMYDASRSNGKVVYRTFIGSYWERNWVCAYRIFG